MAFGFPACHEDLYINDSKIADIKDAVRNTFHGLGWSIILDREDEIVATAEINLLSWGEDIAVTIKEDHVLLIKSRCTARIQCLDWGKNRDNVTKFISELNIHILKSRVNALESIRM